MSGLIVNPYNLLVATKSLRASYVAGSIDGTLDIAGIGGIAGDLAVLVGATSDSNTWQSPSGWTKHAEPTDGANHDRMVVASKLLTGSEGATTFYDTFGFECLVAFFGGLATVSAAQDVGSDMASSPNPQTLTTSGGTKPVIAIVAGRARNDSPDITLQISGVDAEDGDLESDPVTSRHARLKYKIFNTADTLADITGDIAAQGLGTGLVTLYFNVT